jgi:putative membrane protein
MKNNKNEAPVVISNLQNHLANERTFLAWIRTSIGIMAFGFVVEKFSLFLKQIALYLGQSNLTIKPTIIPVPATHSALFGILLVALGTSLCFLSFLKYKSIEIQINQQSYKPTFFLDLMLTTMLCLIGLFLTIYLVHTL